MIFTHAGKLGDLIYSLPVMNWYYKTYGEKIHLVLSSDFDLFTKVMPEFYKHIPCIEALSFVPHQIKNYNEGGQPYRFNPLDYGIKGKYYNLGYRAFPNKYATDFIAEEHGFGVNYENLFDIKPNTIMKKTKIFTNEFDNVRPRINVEDFTEVSFNDPLHVNVSSLLSATEVRVYMSCFSIFCDLLNPKAAYIYTTIDLPKYGPIFFRNHNFNIKNNRYIDLLKEEKK